MRNVLAIVPCGALALLVCGCGNKAGSVSVRPPEQTPLQQPPTDPDAALADQLRAGSVQMAAVSESIQEALTEAKRAVNALKGDLGSAAQEIVDYIDDAGATVAEASADPPTLEQVKKNFAGADDLRKQRIAAGNDAYTSLQEAAGSVTDLMEEVEGLSGLSELLDLAISDLGDAIEAFGGKIQSEEDTPVKDRDGGK